MESETLTLNNAESAASMLPPATGSTNINVGPAERVVSTFLGAAAASYGIRHLGSLGGILMTVAGGMLLSRGLTGYCRVNNAIGRNSNSIIRKNSAMEVKGTFTIDKPRNEVYAFWRKLENLPLFMKHLENVTEQDSVNSTWRARVPGGIGTVSWKALITEDRPQELLTWTSQPGSTVDNAGEVRFKDALDDRGTEVRVCMTYRLPAGDVGNIAGKLFNPAVEKMIREDLKRFKSIMETGEVPPSQHSGVKVESQAIPEKKKTKSRSSKSPDPSFRQTTGAPDDGLQASPTNDITQPTALRDQTYQDDFLGRT